jgi:NADPH:quinone reductase-like Zn-dependent oxidoreductase
MTHPILVTGAAGRVGGVGGLVVEALQRRGLPVRATVRREDERAEALSTASAYRFVRLFSRNRSSLSQSPPPPFVLDAGRGCLHRVSKNPGKMKTRLIAVVPHPRDAKEVATPKSKRE